MEDWYIQNSKLPQNTHIPNSLGMILTIENKTDQDLYVTFVVEKKIPEVITKLFLQNETRFFNRILDYPIYFILDNKQYYIQNTSNTIVFKNASNDIKPSFYFFTKKFVN